MHHSLLRNHLPAPTTRRSPATSRRLLPGLAWLCVLFALAAPSAAEERFYVDFKGGLAAFDRTYEGLHAWDFDNEAVSPAVVFGFELHRNLAIEVGYQRADDLEGWGSACFPGPLVLCIELLAKVEADLELFTFAFVPQTHFGRTTLFGRVGLGYYEERISAVQPTFGYLGRLTGSELLLGAGARVDLTPRLDLLVDYGTVDIDFDSLSLGLGYRF